MKNEVTRIHPNFPTREETKENRELIYSDHSPILATAEIAEGKSVNILSLNVLGPSAGSNFFPNNDWENNQQANERYSRIANFFHNAQKIYKIDIICLQESHHPFMKPKLLKYFKEEGWGYIQNGEGVMTLYNKKKLTSTHDNKQDYDKVANRAISSTFQLKDHEETFDLHNVHTEFNYKPLSQEEKFNSLFGHKKISNSKVAILIGDTNSRIAPNHNDAKNIITGLVPKAFNSSRGAELDVQVGDFPDAAFISDANNKITQLMIKQLSFYNFQILTDDELAENSLEDNIVNSQPLPILCLDSSFHDEKLIHGDMSIFEYEQLLKDSSTDIGFVRLAANLKNKKYLSIEMAHGALANSITEKFKNDTDIKYSRYDDSETCQQRVTVYATLEKIEQLRQYIAEFIEPQRQQINDMVNEQIANVNSRSTFWNTANRPQVKVWDDFNKKIPSVKIGDLPTFISSWSKETKSYNVGQSNDEKKAVSNKDVLAQRITVLPSFKKKSSNLQMLEEIEKIALKKQ